MNKTRKIYALFSMALLLGALAFYTGYTLGQSPITDNVFMPGTQTEQASYMFFQDGSTTYVKDGLTGNIPYSGTNDSNIFQNVLTLCANTSGRSIWVRPGAYALDQALVLDLRQAGSGDFMLIGERGAVFTSTTALPVKVWSCFLEVYGGEGVTIKGITLDDGNSGTDFGIHFSGYVATNNTLVTECSFFNFVDPVTGYLGEVICQHRGHDFRATYNYFENVEQGVVFSASGYNVTNVDISHNTFIGCGHAINCEISGVDGGGAGVTIDSNTITGSDVYTRGLGEPVNGINVYAQSDLSVYHNLAWAVTGNVIRFRPSENATGIRVTTCPGISITGNVIANTHYNDSIVVLYAACGAIQVRGSPGAVVSGNMIYNGTVGINIMQSTYDPDYMAISGNTVIGMTGAGFYLHRASYNTFTGNIAQDCGTWGFQEYYTAQTVNNTYVGNHALDCGIGGFFIQVHASNDAHIYACWNGTEWIATYP